MQKIDFSQVPEINNKLSGEEVSKLNELFATEEVQKDLEEIEVQRKLRNRWYTGAYSLLFIGIPLFIYFTGYFLGPFVGIFLLFGYIRSKFHGKIDIPLKRDVLSKMGILFDDDFQYSPDGKYSFDDLDELKKKGFITNYIKIEKVEDSTSLQFSENGKGFYMRGFELVTSEVNTSGKKGSGGTSLRHNYLTKIVFLKARIPLESDVYIYPKIKTSKNSGNPLWSFIVLMIVPAILLGIVFIEIMNQSPTLGVALLGIIVFAGLMNTKYLSKLIKPNRITLENVEFEERFMTYSEDEIASRMILTQSFMQRIVDFTKKTGQNYSFLFTKNIVYIKKQIQWNYLELKATETIFKDLEGIVEFYIDMKEVILLSKDINFLYLSKTDISMFNENEQIQMNEKPIIFPMSGDIGFSTKPPILPTIPTN